MNHPKQPHSEHQDIWEMLPWFVNGRLAEVDRRRVESHVRQCDTCSAEIELQRQLERVMAADSGVEPMPTAGLNRLRQRIAALDASSPADPLAPATPPGLPAQTPQTARRTYHRSAMAASAAAVAITLGILTAAGWNHAQRRDASARYFTVTTAAQESGNAVIRAVFAPTLTLSEMQGILDDAHLKIVSGPTEAGVYSLAMTARQPVDAPLHRLRAHQAVRFAEAIGPYPGPGGTP